MTDATGSNSTHGSKDSLRVLLATPDYPPPPGGIQTIVANLEEGLKAAGHKVRVLEFDPDDYERSVTDFVPRPRWLYSERALSTAQFVYQSALHRRAQEVIDAFDPDIVHAMHIRELSALVAANERSIPTVLSTYALELEERRLARKAISRSDVVHAISEFTESLVKDAAESPVSTRVIPPSINVGAYRDARERITNADGPRPVVSMARFVDRKNIETVVRAWINIDSDAPPREGRELIVAGDGPNRQDLERLATDADDVRFPGWVNGHEKRELLAYSDAFALVPRQINFDVEGFGIVFIEAQAAGTPVVGSRHGGAPEAIGDGGLVVDNESDVDEVSSALTEIITNEDLHRTCLDAIEDRINQFNVPAVTECHLEVYRDLLSANK